MFRKICSIMMLIIICITSVCPASFVYATESSADGEQIPLRIQLMKKQGQKGYVEHGEVKGVSGLLQGDCILIDLEWICNALGIVYEIKEEQVTKPSSNKIQQTENGEKLPIRIVKKATNTITKKQIYLWKTKDSSLKFVLQVGAMQAYATSSYLGQISVDLGGKVVEKDGKIYVPFTMFLNIFNSDITFEKDDAITLYP